MQRNSVIFGLLVGLITPVLGYFLIDTIFNLLDQMNIMDPDGFSFTWRERTTSLLAICMSLIPFQAFKAQRYDQAMRGMVFPTFILVLYWVYHFQDALFSDYL